MTAAAWVAVGLVAFALVIGMVLLLTRRSRIRKWRFGVFYESEEGFPRSDDPPEPDVDT